MSFKRRTKNAAKFAGAPSSGGVLIAVGIFSVSHACEKVVKIRMYPVSGPDSQGRFGRWLIVSRGYSVHSNSFFVV